MRDDFDPTSEDLLLLAGCSLAKTPGKKDNWIEAVGGELPEYICVVARAIGRGGRSTSNAIEIAIGRIKKWAAGVGNVTAKTQAKAAAAVAQWEALKARAGGGRAKMSRGEISLENALMLCGPSFEMESAKDAFKAMTEDWDLDNDGDSDKIHVCEVWSRHLVVSLPANPPRLFVVPFEFEDGEFEFKEPIEVTKTYQSLEDGADIDDMELERLCDEIEEEDSVEGDFEGDMGEGMEDMSPEAMMMSRAVNFARLSVALRGEEEPLSLSAGPRIRRVRTAAGAKRFKQPIGSIIVQDPVTRMWRAPKAFEMGAVNAWKRSGGKDYEGPDSEGGRAPSMPEGGAGEGDFTKVDVPPRNRPKRAEKVLRDAPVGSEIRGYGKVAWRKTGADEWRPTDVKPGLDYPRPSSYVVPIATMEADSVSDVGGQLVPDRVYELHVPQTPAPASAPRAGDSGQGPAFVPVGGLQFLPDKSPEAVFKVIQNPGFGDFITPSNSGQEEFDAAVASAKEGDLVFDREKMRYAEFGPDGSGKSVWRWNDGGSEGMSSPSRQGPADLYFVKMDYTNRLTEDDYADWDISRALETKDREKLRERLKAMHPGYSPDMLSAIVEGALGKMEGASQKETLAFSSTALAGDGEWVAPESSVAREIEHYLRMV